MEEAAAAAVPVRNALVGRDTPGVSYHFFPPLLKLADTEVVTPATVQVPVPLHPPPLQPLNRAPFAGTAVRVMPVPGPNVAEHTEPHVIPAGLLTTEPGPCLLTERVNVDEPGGGVVEAGTVSKVAVTVAEPFPTRPQGSVPLQPPPDQPLNVDPVDGVAASVTTVPA